MSDAYYDELETRSAEEREGALFAALPAHIEHTRSNTVAFRSLLADVDPQAVHNRKALAELPITRKSDLLELQKQAHPFGGYAAIGPREAARVFVSPGPNFEPQARRPDFWSEARALVEIVRPGTGEPVADGEVGEVVVTALTPEYPLIRFATEDLSAVMAGPSPCGHTNLRIKGWMGRADQSITVKGMLVHPKQASEVCARHSEIRLARLLVKSENSVDHMTLQCETDAVGDQSLNGAIADTIRQVCKLRGDVKLVPPGSLPNDGKVLDGQRTYE